jgi:hypothetical protein
MDTNRTVGIIANPASGKDIRRLVAQGLIFDNYEKVNIVRRVLLGMEAAGVAEVLYMPDYFDIVGKAVDGIKLKLGLYPLEMPLRGNQDDSTEAALLMAERDVACIVTLGGDGTNRAVVKGVSTVPLMPISTGTNNVFPFMVEGTLAGLAAGMVATGAVPLNEAAIPTNRLDVLFDGKPEDLALVDIAVYDDVFIGSRAIWDTSKVQEIFLSRDEPATMGLSSIGGCLYCSQANGSHGTHICLAGPEDSKALEVLAPVAPGRVESVKIASFSLLETEDEVPINLIPSVLALDGEREIEVGEKRKVSVRFSNHGPLVIKVDHALRAATKRNSFISAFAPETSKWKCTLAQRGLCLTPC